MLKIVIVESQALIREGFRSIFQNAEQCELVGEATTVEEAEEKIHHAIPDVVLLAHNLSDQDGLHLIASLREQFPQVHVIVFVPLHADTIAFQAMCEGAMGCLTYNCSKEMLIHTIQCASHTNVCIAPQFSSIIDHLRRTQHLFLPSASLPSRKQDPQLRMHRKALQEEGNGRNRFSRPLSGRERQILSLMSEGKRNSEIAVELALAESTVHKHVQNIFGKLGVRNRVEAITLALTEIVSPKRDASQSPVGERAATVLTEA